MPDWLFQTQDIDESNSKYLFACGADELRVDAIVNYPPIRSERDICIFSYPLIVSRTFLEPLAASSKNKKKM